MDPVANPYSPGAGRKPAALVGRDDVLSQWSTSLRRTAAGRPDPPVVLYGLRGVGKTVLLTELRRMAAADDWIVAQIEAETGRSLRELLGEALYEPLSDLARPGIGRRILKALKTAASFKASYDPAGNTWSFGVNLDATSGGGADTGRLDTDLRKLVRDLSEAGAEIGVGLAILIDEAQDLTREELTALCTLAHAAAQDGWHFMLAFAGLPSLPRALAEAKSYAERYQYLTVEALDDDAARAALTVPATGEGVVWAQAAVSEVIEQSGRYPYFLQQFGQGAWTAAPGTTIEHQDAVLGVATGRAQLDNGFFRVRWDRATPAEQGYLRAMADDGDGPSASGDVAARLHRTVQQLGPARANLIAKGLLYAPDYGQIAFTVPGMADFIKRQIDT
ncbi:ATP-binding protein [Tsukamurella sp. 8F]|uniref:ATP-binding protein n=1 Tax=unclassified Tsukamurella TaxID=2633480 RepID=UPI0023B9EACD|nr:MULTISPECIES: ATP-binding protein [unclassified Tsukamurella]MDF0532272.1 ATP-binding protein [Tsukamurella sp. 8J]MDF0589298.1 ATP-binding protein [Tsukamurella sp. 8F]